MNRMSRTLMAAVGVLAAGVLAAAPAATAEQSADPIGYNIWGEGQQTTEQAAVAEAIAEAQAMAARFKYDWAKCTLVQSDIHEDDVNDWEVKLRYLCKWR